MVILSSLQLGTRRALSAALSALGLLAMSLLAACDDANQPRPAPPPAAAASAASAALGSGTVDSARFVRLEESSEVNGNAWASVAELNVLDAAGETIPRTGWTASADSEERIEDDTPAARAIDGNPNSFWHTEWQGSGPPHQLVIDLGAEHSIGGFRYLPRQSGPNGRIAAWRFSTSPNGSTWTLAAAGTFADGAAEATVRFAAPKVAPEAAPAPLAAAPSASAGKVAAMRPARAARIAAFAAGPLVPGLPWRAGEAVAAEEVRRLASGQHLVYTGAGSTGGTEPAGEALVDGRPVADGTATAYLTGRVLGGVRAEAPTVSTFPSALAAGLVMTSLAGGDLRPPKFAAVQGCRSISTGISFIGHYCFANGPAGGSGNATAIATGAQGARLPAEVVYHANSWEEEFVVTDKRFGLVFANSASPIDVEIDGTPVQAGPARSTGAEGWTLVFEYPAARRRTVRVVSAVGSVAPTLRGVALGADGRVEAGATSADQLLILGDSVNATVTPASEAGLQMPSYWLQRDLGFGGAINMAVGGAGYVAKNPGAFNLPELLAHPVNQTLLAGYAPFVTHVLVGAGFADRSLPVADVQAAALASWKALRELLPNAKISITDGWSGSTGPDARTLALAAGIASAFTKWGDDNARLIRVVGTAAATAYVTGTGTAGLPPAAGNASVYISTDAVHPSPAGGRYLARRLADDIAAAWGAQGY